MELENFEKIAAGLSKNIPGLLCMVGILMIFLAFYDVADFTSVSLRSSYHWEPILTGFLFIIFYWISFLRPNKRKPSFDSESNEFPSVSGKYMVEYSDKDANEIVEIQQLGSDISGNIKIDGGKIEYLLKGKVTASRYITYQVTPITDNFDGFGVALLRLNQNGNEAKGFLLFVSESGLPASYSGKIARVL